MYFRTKLAFVLLFTLLANRGECKKKRRNAVVVRNNDKHHNEELRNVAFSVALNKSVHGHKQKQTAVVFDNILLNIGDCYDAFTGEFIAPRDGVYEFTFSGSGTPDKRLSLQLMKNKYEVQVLAYDGNQRKHHNTQKQNILLQLQPGDRVWLHVPRRKEYGLQGADGTSAAVFSGRLLHSKAGKKSREMDISHDEMYVLTETPNHHDDKKKRHRRSSDNVIRRRASEVNSDAVAFSAACTMSVLSGNQTEPAMSPRYVTSQNGRVKFDKVFVNLGNTFNDRMGVFTTPFDGVYYFAFTVGKYPMKKLSVALMKNDDEFQVLIYNENETQFREMQSQSVMLQLVAGDRVYLKTYNDAEYALYSNLGNYITFTGYLVFAT